MVRCWPACNAPSILGKWGKIQMLFNALHVIVRKRCRCGIFQDISCSPHRVQNMKLLHPPNPLCLVVHIKMPPLAYIKLGRLVTQVSTYPPACTAPTFMLLGPKFVAQQPGVEEHQKIWQITLTRCFYRLSGLWHAATKRRRKCGNRQKWSKVEQPGAKIVPSKRRPGKQTS